MAVRSPPTGTARFPLPFSPTSHLGRGSSPRSPAAAGPARDLTIRFALPSGLRPLSHFYFHFWLVSFPFFLSVPASVEGVDGRRCRELPPTPPLPHPPATRASRATAVMAGGVELSLLRRRRSAAAPSPSPEVLPAPRRCPRRRKEELVGEGGLGRVIGCGAGRERGMGEGGSGGDEPSAARRRPISHRGFCRPAGARSSDRGRGHRRGRDGRAAEAGRTARLEGALAAGRVTVRRRTAAASPEALILPRIREVTKDHLASFRTLCATSVVGVFIPYLSSRRRNLSVLLQRAWSAWGTRIPPSTPSKIAPYAHVGTYADRDTPLSALAAPLVNQPDGSPRPDAICTPPRGISPRLWCLPTGRLPEHAILFLGELSREAQWVFSRPASPRVPTLFRT